MAIKDELKQVFIQNRNTAIVIIIAEVILYFTYMYIPLVNSTFQFIGSIKDKTSIVFSFIMTALFMGIIPTCMDYFQHKFKTDAYKYFLYSGIAMGIVVCNFH